MRQAAEMAHQMKEGEKKGQGHDLAFDPAKSRKSVASHGKDDSHKNNQGTGNTQSDGGAHQIRIHNSYIIRVAGSSNFDLHVMLPSHFCCT